MVSWIASYDELAYGNWSLLTLDEKYVHYKSLCFILLTILFNRFIRVWIEVVKTHHAIELIYIINFLLTFFLTFFYNLNTFFLNKDLCIKYNLN